MNSTLDMLFPGIITDQAELLFWEVQQESLALEKLLSCFNPISETYQLNEKALNNPVQISDRLWNILTECINFNRLTGGYFDVGFKLFKDNPAVRLESVLPAVGVAGMKAIETDEDTHSVRFLSEKVGLDFGAIGKGLVLREINNILTKHKIENCFISFGGSSILTRGHHPHGTAWPVSFRTNYDNITAFYMNDHFASFSSTFPENNSNGHGHIINPLTMEAVKQNRVACIRSNCPVMAEVLSTALIISSFNEAGEIAKALQPDQVIVYEYDNVNNHIGEFKYEK
jgi:thiamine biosynthesis lipoprotein